jgi:hypothetical protein
MQAGKGLSKGTYPQCRHQKPRATTYGHSDDICVTRKKGPKARVKRMPVYCADGVRGSAVLSSSVLISGPDGLAGDAKFA